MSPVGPNPRLLLPALAAVLLALSAAACGDDEGRGDAPGGDDVVSTTLDPGDDDATIPDLPVNDDPEAVTCTGDPGGTLDATALVGLDLAEAEQRAREPGCSVREVVRDGEGLAVTEDFRPDRVNVATEDGVVVEVVSLG